jgi:hypothetical protein
MSKYGKCEHLKDLGIDVTRVLKYGGGAGGTALDFSSLGHYV